METNLRGEMTVAVDDSQFTLKDSGFVRAIASTLRASTVEVSWQQYFMHDQELQRTNFLWLYLGNALHPQSLASASSVFCCPEWKHYRCGGVV